VVKALDWFARLRSGRRDSVGVSAREEQVTSSYVTRVAHLAFLAPDIVQGILRGHHPPELNAERLIHIVPLPLTWDEQRALLAMTDLRRSAFPFRPPIVDLCCWAGGGEVVPIK